jgi:dolichol kinase
MLIPASVLAVTADALRTRHAPFRAIIRRIFGGMMRPDEWPPLGGPVVLNGATWMLLSVTLTTALFPARIAVPVLVVFMIADAMAALVGRTWGRTEWGATGRTVEGSLAFLAAGLLVMAAFPIPFGLSAAGVLVATTVEILPWPLNDNIRVPIAFGAALFLMETLV